MKLLHLLSVCICTISFCLCMRDLNIQEDIIYNISFGGISLALALINLKEFFDIKGESL